MVTPADGPSLGVAPDGTWIWMSLVMKLKPFTVFASLDRIRLSDIVADSFITSPSWPVRVSLPVPGMNVPSTKRISPPTGVHASPVTMPGTCSFRATSCRISSFPRIPGSLSVVTTNGSSAVPETIFSDMYRAVFASCFFNHLTPASRVYFSMITFSASSSIRSLSASRPCSCKVSGSRWSFAMANFSFFV